MTTSEPDLVGMPTVEVAIAGPPGPEGPQGPQGPPGGPIIDGGTQWQTLVKQSSANGDAAWGLPGVRPASSNVVLGEGATAAADTSAGGFQPSVVAGYNASAGTSTYAEMVIIGGSAAVLANGYRCVAVGAGSRVASGGTAVGLTANASGASATAIGSSSTVAGANSTGVGTGTVASGASAVAIGQSASATAGQGIALGASAQARVVSSSSQNMALGYMANASGTGAAAIGRMATAAHNYSTALGYGATTTAARQIVLGTTAETTVVPGPLDARTFSPQMIDALRTALGIT